MMWNSPSCPRPSTASELKMYDLEVNIYYKSNSNCSIKTEIKNSITTDLIPARFLQRSVQRQRKKSDNSYSIFI